VKIGERADRFMPAERTSKSFLEVGEFLALLDAAGELDRAKRREEPTGIEPVTSCLQNARSAGPVPSPLKTPKRPSAEG
jgi:hypothetical protein